MKNGIVIPCYNEAARLDLAAFASFIQQRPDYRLCFVNDGSTDDTLQNLRRFQRAHGEQVLVYDMPQNGGKAAAVRAGVFTLLADPRVRSVGFIDADLSTGFADYTTLVNKLHAPGRQELVFGSRCAEADNHIERTPFRALTSKAVGVLIRSLLRLPIEDTQCGAKVFTAELARICFAAPFVTRWLFDVELFMRARRHYGPQVMQRLQESPLREWIHVEGSKITLRDSLEIPAQLAKIGYAYELQPALSGGAVQLGRFSRRLATSLNLL